MDPLTLRPSSVSLSPPQVQRVVDTWRVGQVLEASVVSPPGSDSVTLKVGDLVLTAKGGLPEQLQRGPLQLLVQSVGAQPSLRVLTPPGTVETASTQALRQTLPRQMPLPPLLANLSRFLEAPRESLPGFPREVVLALERLIATIPEVRQVSQANGVARAVQDSGLFLESKLRTLDSTQAKQVLSQDFKAALLQTLAAIKKASSPPPQTSASAATSRPPQAEGLQATAALARNPPAPLSTAQGTGGGPAPGTPAPPAATVAGLGPAPKETSEGGAQATARAWLLPTAGTPPPLRGTSPAPQGRVDPTITAALSPELALRQLVEQLEGAVARLSATQASQLPSDDTQRPPAWTFELPVRHQSHVDLVGVHIERDAETGKEQAHGLGWNVTLSFDFPETGAFYAQLKVLGKSVGCRFTAERQQTVQQLERKLSQLDQSLRDAGLEVGELRARQGSMPPAKHLTLSPLLDLRA